MKRVQKGNFDVYNVIVWILSIHYAACRVGSDLHIRHSAARGRLFPRFYSPNGFDIKSVFLWMWGSGGFVVHQYIKAASCYSTPSLSSCRVWLNASRTFTSLLSLLFITTEQIIKQKLNGVKAWIPTHEERKRKRKQVAQGGQKLHPQSWPEGTDDAQHCWLTEKPWMWRWLAL